MVDGEMHDVRIVGGITVIFLFCIAMIGTEWESKVYYIFDIFIYVFKYLKVMLVF